MKRKIAMLAVLVILALAGTGLAGDGLVRLRSGSDVATTAGRLEKALAARGLTLFARIDHRAGALKAGRKLRPTELFIFGNPKAGTALMRCGQTVGIDLPLKILLYEDEQGQTWIVYNDPGWLAGRHGLNDCGANVIARITAGLAGIAHAAAGD